MTLGRLRREIEPVSAADFMRFLFRWQHVQPGTHLHGRQGVLEIVSSSRASSCRRVRGKRTCCPRASRYDPNDLEQLCLAGAVAWGRLRAGAPADEDEEQAGPRRARTPNRAAPLAFVLRDDLPWLIEPQTAAPDVSGDAELVLEHLHAGASFVSDVARGTRLLPAAVEEALWTLVASGLVTGDGTAGWRAHREADDRRTRRLHMLRGGRGRLVPAGRWALLRDTVEEASHDVERFARQWLRRYGVVMRELLAREPRMPPWRDVVRVLRTLEARGEVRGGRFVAGMVGEQFALPEAVEALRAVRRKPGAEEIVVVAAGVR
jgi:ATP-dependent Lhr-like helicase